ncbi:Protein kinase-like domain protein [Cordyceps fumosorosea ARSEF 2679]|uniref:Protein kinase-like domain protein n=1 Tax=Cordyceps fumosorosea (strain ARSEF 2679) TaxID=1081104 RepID=A0A167W0Y0_CORFA|nr:Protein kinase-like domain protein [Cordyceps fumosorosea ARSEF 2679]OAA63197.1 Protein kinase-like domain protein [Cordyceps fumosorosea ARSEF 2679]
MIEVPTQAVMPYAASVRLHFIHVFKDVLGRYRIQMWMQGDDIAREESDRIERERREGLMVPSTQLAIGNFIAKHWQGIPEEIGPLKAGAFNALFRLTYRDGGSVVIRFATPGRTMFPEEKIRNEVVA